MKIFEFIIESSIIVTILIPIILMIQKLLKKSLSPRISYYFWIIIIIKLLIPMNIESDFSINRIFNIPNKVTEKIEYKNKQDKTQVIVTKDKETISKLNTQILFKNLWFFTVAVFLGYGLFLYLNLNMKIKKASVIKGKRYKTVLDDCLKILNLKKDIKIIETDMVKSPAIYGLFKVKILVPKNLLNDISDQDMKYIFMHELVHFKNGDIFIAVLMQFANIIYFFNPLVYIARKKMQNDCELACDYRVLSYLNGTENKAYGETLLNIVSKNINEKYIPVSTGMARNKKEIWRRINMISKNKRFGLKQTLIGAGALLMVGAVGLTSYADGTANTGKEDKKNNEVVGSMNQNNAASDKIEAIIEMDDKTGEVISINKVTGENVEIKEGSKLYEDGKYIKDLEAGEETGIKVTEDIGVKYKEGDNKITYEDEKK